MLIIEDGKLRRTDIVQMFKACLLVIHKPTDESEIENIVEALWEDWGMDSQNPLEIRKVRTMFSTHEGLNEGLTKRYVHELAVLQSHDLWQCIVFHLKVPIVKTN